MGSAGRDYFPVRPRKNDVSLFLAGMMSAPAAPIKPSTTVGLSGESTQPPWAYRGSTVSRKSPKHKMYSHGLCKIRHPFLSRGIWRNCKRASSDGTIKNPAVSCTDGHSTPREYTFGGNNHQWIMGKRGFLLTTSILCLDLYFSETRLRLSVETNDPIF